MTKCPEKHTPFFLTTKANAKGLDQPHQSLKYNAAVELDQNIDHAVPLDS